MQHRPPACAPIGHFVQCLEPADYEPAGRTDWLSLCSVINQIQMPDGVAQVTQQLEARRKDPDAQLFPEITVSTIGQDHMRASEPKLAVEVLKLVLLAYPESAARTRLSPKRI